VISLTYIYHLGRVPSLNIYNTSLETDKWRSWRISDELTEQRLVRPEVLFETCVAMKFVDDDDN